MRQRIKATEIIQKREKEKKSAVDLKDKLDFLSSFIDLRYLLIWVEVKQDYWRSALLHRSRVVSAKNPGRTEKNRLKLFVWVLRDQLRWTLIVFFCDIARNVSAPTNTVCFCLYLATMGFLYLQLQASASRHLLRSRTNIYDNDCFSDSSILLDTSKSIYDC